MQLEGNKRTFLIMNVEKSIDYCSWDFGLKGLPPILLDGLVDTHNSIHVGLIIVL